MSYRVLSTNKLRMASAGIASVVLAAFVLPAAVAFAAAVPAADRNVTAVEVQSTLMYESDMLAASSQTKTTSDSNSALKAAIAGVIIDVPNHASDGVTIGTASGPKLDIQLPNAIKDANAAKVANGVVAYAGVNGSANAVQATEDGGIRMLTIIDNPTAPTAYDYKVTVPNGGHIALTKAGGAVVLDGKGAIIASVAAPWAHDAVGKSIATYFTTDGTTLTQHIQHNVPGVVYPVTADPSISFGWFAVYINLSPADQRNIIIGGSAAAAAVACDWVSEGLVAAGCKAVSAYIAYYVSEYYHPNHWAQLKFNWVGQFQGIREL